MSYDPIVKAPSHPGGFFQSPANELEVLRNLSWHCLLVLDEEYLERGSYPHAWPVLPSYDNARFREQKVSDHLAALVEAMHEINPLSEARRLPARSAIDFYDASRLFRNIIMDLLRRQDPRADAIRAAVRRILEEALAKWPRAFCWYACEVLPVAADPSAVLANLGRATAHATNAKDLNLVQQTYAFAAAKISERFQGPKPVPATPLPSATTPNCLILKERGDLTRGQRDVLTTCVALGEIFYGPRPEHSVGIQPLLFPLLIGPTGSGKTFLVRQLAERLKAQLLIRVTRADFIPQGARQRPTVFQICDALVQKDRVVLHIDELDKLRADGGPTPVGDWGASIYGDIWNTAEGRLPIENYLADNDPGKPSTHTLSAAEMRQRVQTRLFVVASGTFQETWEKAVKPRLGFGETTGRRTAAITTDDILRSKNISPELIARFHPPLFLDYAEPAEVAQMLESAGIMDLARACHYEITAADLDLRRTGFRGLESLYATLLLARHKLERAPTHPAPEGPARPAASNG